MVGRKKIVFFVAIVISIALTSFFIFQTQIGPVINRPPSFFAWDPCRPKTGLLTDPHPVFEPNEDFLVPFLRKRGLPAQRGVGVRREGLDPLEGYLFRQPPTTDSRCLPEELNSTVHIINPHDRYIVGDTVQLFVDLYTGYGTRRHWGGDDVRLWLKSAKGNSSMAVKVTDLNNGSYVGYAVLKWPGITLVRVSLAHPQEYLRGLAEMLHTIGNLRWSVDTFNNTQRTKEKTLCSPLAPIPGFAKICNLTSRNGDRSWFCSHPVSEGLNCSHWSKTHNMPPLSDTQWPITSVVRPFIAKLRKCCKNVTLPLRLISNNISINVKEGTRKKPPALRPCWSIPRRETWYTSSRTGWFQNGTWQSDTCSLPDLTRQRVLNCMRNTTLVLQGDSNQRLWWDTIHGFLPCSYVHKEGQWHAPRLCQNHNLSSTLIFCSHAMPFFPGSHTDLVTVSLPRALDKLLHHTPQGGKAVFVLHYYLHFTTYSLHVYRQRVREARRTLEQFVQLHPNVKVIIRAPHACYQSCHLGQTLIGDVVVAAYTEVWKEEFVGLEDKVWFLDLWDATVAAESVPIHPAPSLTKELLKNYNLSSTLIFCSHAMPFSPGIHTDLVTVSLPRALDKLLRHTPPGGKAVFVLHYYRHFTTYSLHVYRQRVREARRTLEQFVQLHPNVKVIIRAPHACYQSCHLGQTLIGDVVVAAYTEVWKEEFVGLEDKVWFLDLWDATVAAESVFIHPVPSVTKELLKVLFGYFCEGNM